MIRVQLTRIMFPVLLMLTANPATAATADSIPTKDKICGEGSLLTAKAKVTIQRMHWVHERGDYTAKTDEVCTVNAIVPVIDGPLGNCMAKNTASCPIPLDGKVFKINAAGYVQIDHSTSIPTKRFQAWYHVDRNSGSTTTGEASSAEISTQDLELKKIGLAVQSKFDGFTPGKAGRDGIIVTIDFEGNDAP